MDDWLTIRVELVGRLDPMPVPAPRASTGTRLAEPAGPPPGRVLLVAGRHRFAELAIAVDTGFGRWDLDRPRLFAVEGRELVDAVDVVEQEADDDLDVEVGDVGLRAGARFTYVFDDVWLHRCTVTAVGVDPIATSGVEPDAPRPVFGWGTLPDQDGRTAADAPVGRPAAEDLLRADWAAAEEAAVRVLDAVVSARDVPAPDAASLARAVALVRERASADGDWAARVLWTAAGPGARDDADPAVAWQALAAAAAGVTGPGHDVPPEVDDDTYAAWTAVEPLDLAAAVLVLVQGGVGASAQPDDLLSGMAGVSGAEALSPEQEDLIADGLDVVGDLWRALGALDAERRLTALGRWGLPAALRGAWAPDA